MCLLIECRRRQHRILDNVVIAGFHNVPEEEVVLLNCLEFHSTAQSQEPHVVTCIPEP